MLTTQTALPELERRLAAAGFDPATAQLDVFWSVWRPWVAEPVEGMDPEQSADMVLFEANLSLREPAEWENPKVPPKFGLHFVRQFSFSDDDGDYSHMEQLFVDFTYDPVQAFRDISTMTRKDSGSAACFWGAPVDGASAWCARVEASPAYLTALQHAPRRVQLAHDRV